MLVRLFSVLLLSILLISGCTRSVEQQAEVSGKVTYKGKPLPGGRITFISPKGHTGSSVISPQGEYKLKAPIGDVQISVDNRMLNRDDPSSLSSREKEGYLSRGRLKKPSAGGQQPPQQEITGTYVPLPKKYVDSSTSGLKYTVESGSQTHDVELSDNP